MKYYLFLLFLGIISCSSESKYKIIHKKVHLKNARHSYPQISKTGANAKQLDSLNNMLNKFGEFDYYVKRATNATVISSSYKTLLHQDSLLSFEFITVTRKGSELADTTYKGLTLNLLHLDVTFKNCFIVEPSQIHPYINREKLIPFIKKVDSSINMRAYERNSEYAISWALTPDSFMLYVGGEGEFFGKKKVSIPLKELH